MRVLDNYFELLNNLNAAPYYVDGLSEWIKEARRFAIRYSGYAASEKSTQWLVRKSHYKQS